jgi:N6-L-threonylcarbamoyladenine synthase
MAKKSSRKYIEMPYVVKGMDVSFSGILTYVEELVKGERKSLTKKQKSTMTPQQIKDAEEQLKMVYTKEDLCWSL